MEVVSIVVGGVGLAISFRTCMETFEYVDIDKKYGKDYQKAVLNLAVLELRLSRWSQQVQFSEDPKVLSGGAAVATPQQSEHVQGLLGQIQADLEDAAKASRRYALPSEEPEKPEDRGTAKLESLTSRFRQLALERQGRTSLIAKTRWALKDKRKLHSLIEDIAGSVGSLETVFPATMSRSKQQRQAVVNDVQKLVEPTNVEEPEDDPESISTILREAAVRVDTQLQEAIDIVLKNTEFKNSLTLKDIAITHQAEGELGDFIASGYIGPSP